MECYRVPCFFYAYPGRISNNPHEFMETRCVLPSMRNIAAPADCTRPQLGGGGRNRYVAAAPAWSETPGHAAQNSKSRLNGRLFKIWSCAPAPYGKGTHVCAALTGRVLQPAPGAAAAVMMRRKQIFVQPPLSPTHRPNQLYEPPRRMGNATGARGGFSPGPIF